jgi:filamentous hemagglutinin family protein
MNASAQPQQSKESDMPARPPSPSSPSPAQRRRLAARQRAWARRRPRLSRLLAWLLAGLWGTASLAQVAPGTLPGGGQVVVGSGQLLQSANLLVVQQNSARLGLDWQSFNIGPGATVEFRQPGASAIALNRVLGNSGSQIFGQLKANGQVFLTNPNGVLFAPGAQVDVGGLVASTLDLSQQDFAAGRYVFAAGGNGSSGSVVNQGQLRAQAGGYLALFGQQVSNSGSLAVDAGSVLLASGRAATVSISGSGLISAVVTPGVQGSVVNSGSIAADGGTVTLTAKSAQDIAASLVNNSGIVRANTLVEKAGEIWITGDNVASSGQISAAAPAGGDAGRISLIADMQAGTAQIGGTLDASAAAGRGGFIETSGARVKVAEGTQVTTLAPQGGTGTWLVDPTDITIAPSGGDFTGAQVSGFVNSNNYTVTSSAGSINVNDAITWSQNKLTLSSFANVNINAALTATNTASLALEYGQGAVAAGNTANYSVAVPVALPAGTSFSTKLGSNGSTAAYTVVNTLSALRLLDGNTATLSANYALGADIDASATAVAGQGFDPIGNQGDSVVTSNSFSGRFDGLGHTISGLTINMNASSVGLFATAYNADIRNLVLTGGSVSATINGGALAGIVDGSTRITNVKSANSVTLTGNSVNTAGGLVGQALGTGTIRSSTVSGAITATAGRGSAGGLAGLFAMSGGQSGNRVDGLVSGGNNTGGLIGYYNSSAVLSDGQYTAASVSGGTWVGGLIGFMNQGSISGASSANPLTVAADVNSTGNAGGMVGRSIGDISNIKATGKVTGGGSSSIGGAIGVAAGGALSNLQATGNVSGGSSSNIGGLVGWTQGTGSLRDSVASGSVTGPANTSSVGGLVGYYGFSGTQTGNRVDGLVSGGFNTGGLIGYYDSAAAITDGTYTPSSVSGGAWVGGLIGYMNQAASISGASAASPLTVAADVTATGSAGGLVGRSFGAVSNVKATGKVTSAGNGNVGGLIGQADGSGGLTNATATGKVSGAVNNGSVGGLVGAYQNSGATSGNRAEGVVSGGSNTGGLYGYYNSTAAITDGVFTQASISGGAWVGGLVGYMNQAASITGASAGSPWVIATNVTATASGGGAGGFAGRSYGSLANLKATGTVTANVSSTQAGGLVGRASGATGTTLSNLSATGSVTSNSGSSVNVGGLIGWTDGTGTLSASSASGNVVATTNAGSVGGLVGAYEFSGATSGNSASGVVSGGYNTGGLYGWYNSTAAITDGTFTQPSISGGTWVGGLIGYMNQGSSISGASALNPMVVAVSVTATGNAGGLAGRSVGSISNVVSTGNVAGGNNFDIGGLVGQATGTGTLSNSKATGTVTGGSNSAVGGLVGEYALSGAQTGNRAEGVVSGGYYTGGLIGYYNSTAAITDGVFTQASISGGTWVGGLIGYMAQAASISGASALNPLTVAIDVTATGNAGGLVGRSFGAVSNVRSTGKVTGAGNSNVGGLIGQADGSGGITNATATGNVTGTTSSGSVGGLVGAYQNSGATSGNRVEGIVSGGSNTGGLYGYYNSTAAVTDGTFTQTSITGGAWVGGLIGYMNQAASISGASAANPWVMATNVTATVNGGGAGGFAGRSYGTLANLKATGTVTANVNNTQVGGLVGRASGSTGTTLSNLTATGTVTSNSGSSLNVGGLIGWADGTGTLTASSASGNVVAPTNAGSVGGLVGAYEFSGATSGNSASGIVTGGFNTGGLYGYYNSAATITDGSYTRPSITGGTFVGGLIGQMNQGAIIGPASGSPWVVSIDVTATGTGNFPAAGGVVGRSVGPVANISSTGSVRGAYDVGGLIGRADGTGTLTHTSASGNVTSSSTGSGSVGGLVGSYQLSGAQTGNMASGVLTGGNATGGLFGYYNSTAAITDGTYTQASITGGAWVGGLIGYMNQAASISGASAANPWVIATNVTATVNGGGAGGFAGRSYGTLANLKATGTVTANVNSTQVGGLVGRASGSTGTTLSNLTATGTVTSNSGSSLNVGGLIGWADGTGTLSASSASGNVVGPTNAGSVGGLVGAYEFSGATSGNSAAGVVTGGFNTGGLYGWYNSAAAITDGSYNQPSITGGTYVGGIVGQMNNGSIGGPSISSPWTISIDVTGTAAYNGQSPATGGFAGRSYGSVANLKSTGNVQGKWDVGGVVGAAMGTGTFTNNTATGNVTSSITSGGSVGGLVGYYPLSGAQTGNTASGVVTGGNNTGGLIGYYSSSAPITDGTYTQASITGGEWVGGLIGYMAVAASISGPSAANPWVMSTNVTATVNGGAAGGFVGRSLGSMSNLKSTGNVGGLQDAGGVVGRAEGTGSMNSVSATGNITGGNNNGGAGGVVGSYNLSGAITGASAAGSVSGGNSTGGLIGYYNSAATISDGAVTSTLVSGGQWVGGLIGYMGQAAAITGPSAANPLTVSANVTGSGQSGGFGGLVGRSFGPVSNVRATGNVSGGGDYSSTGGLIGLAQGTGAVSNSSASGNVTAVNSYSNGSGGLVGSYFLSASQTGNSASGTVSGGYYAGGLIGYYNTAAAITSGNAATNGVSGSTWVGGLVGYMDTAAAITGASAANPLTVGASVTSTGNAGGVVGHSSGAISNVLATGAVTGTGNVGGIVGQAEGTGSLSNSKATGNVTATANNGSVGGLAGSLSLSGGIVNSEADGNVSGGYYTGGLVGLYNSNTALVTDAATGKAITVNATTVSGSNYVGGLVGYMNSSAAITGVSVAANVTATGSAGGLAGRTGGNVTGSSASGTVTGNGSVGGLIGEAAGSGTISNSSASGKVTGSATAGNVGGLVGLASGGSITGSNASGAVSGGVETGGLVGWFNNNGDIVGGLATGSVSAAGDAGGLLGFGQGSGKVRDSKATGNVSTTATSSQKRAGGLVGDMQMAGGILNSEADGNVSGGYYAGGLVGYYTSPVALVTDSSTGQAITVKAATVTGLNFTGGLVGYSTGGAAITGITVTANVSSSASAGGLAGYSNGNVSKSSASGSVTGGSNSYVGGLIGQAAGAGTLTDVGASGNVTGGSSANVGGLVGYYTQTGGIARAQASGTVSGGSSTGGLVGYFYSSSTTLDTGTYTGLSVSGTGSVGGLVGSANSMTLTASSTSARVSGGSYAGGLVGYGSGIGSISGSNAGGDVSASTAAGGLVGAMESYTITGSQAYGNVSAVGSTVYAGGLVGQVNGNYYYYYYNNPSYIITSQASGNVVADAASAYVGGLVGSMQYGSISGGTASGKVTGLDSSNSSTSGYYVGGLVGYYNGVTTGSGIAGSSASGAVTGRYYTGGLVGYFTAGTLTGDSASGSVTGGNRVGGLVGYASVTTPLTNVSATGNVSAPASATYVGGLVGQLDGAGINTGSASGKVTSAGTSGSVGGLVGYANSSISTSVGAAINDSWASGDVSGGAITGGLVGNYSNNYSYGGITNSHASGNVVGGNYGGGLVGSYSAYGMTASDIVHSWASGAVSGTQYVGGLVGSFQGTKGLSTSYASGDVTGRGLSGSTVYLGGLVGQYYFYNYALPTGASGLTLSYATGKVSQTAAVTLTSSSTVYAGGLVGFLDAYYSGSVALADAYATGSVTVANANGQLRGGGLVGYANASLARAYASGLVAVTGGNTRLLGGLVAQRNSSATVTNSYWDTSATGQATSQGGTGLTSAQMQQAASFTGFSLASDGSGGKTWRIYAGHTAPLLSTFLEPLTLTLADASKTYDGTTSFGNAAIAGASGPVGHPERIFTSLLSPDVGSYAVSAGTLYSTQQGYDLTVAGNATLTVTPRPLTLAGVIADKVYDGTTNATIVGTAQPTGLVAGEDLTINVGNVAAHFDTKNVGTNKTVTVSGYTLANGVHGKASNYSIGAGTNTTASITPASLTAGGFAATDRNYDGTTLVAVQATGSSSITGVIAGDDVHVDLSAAGSGQMADKNVGSAKPVTVTGVALTGSDAGNYKVTGIDSVTVNIAPKPVTVNSITASDRAYNGSTAVTVNTGSGVISGLVAGDLVSVQSSTLTGSMADKNVGMAKPVSLSGVLLRGPDAANYTAQTGAVTVNITQATAYLNVYRTNGTDKVYDGSTAASVGMSLSNVYGNDQLTLLGATAAYTDKNVAYTSGGLPATKTITVSGATLGGTDAANYTLNTSYYGASTYGTISPKALPVTGIVAVNRVYDGSTTVAVNVSNASVDTSGLIVGDSVSVNVPSAVNGTVAGTVADRSAANGKSVSVPGLTLGGADGANYTFGGTGGLTVNITPKPVTASYVGVDRVYDGSNYAQVVASSGDLLGIDLAGGGVSFYSNNYGYGYGYAVFTGNGAKNVGTAKPISVTYDVLQGSNAGNYTLVGVGQGTASASITPRPLTSLVYVGGTRVYDGSTTASVTLDKYYSNIISSDAVTTTQDAVFTGTGAKNVGSGKAIAVTNIALGGSDAFNYTLVGNTASTTGSITPKAVTFTGISAVSRTYDGTTAVTVNASGVTSSGFVTGDLVAVQQPAGGLTSGTVATKDVGTNKTVTVTGLSLTGSDAGNYSIDAAGSGIKVNITAKGLTASYVGVNKVYDGGVTAQVTGSSADIVAGDSVGFGQSAIFTGLDARNVGTAKSVSVAGITLTGTDRANYALVNTTASASADITPKPVTVTWTGVSRVYDGVADRSASVQSQTGDFVAGDTVTLSQSALFRTDGSAGVGKAIDISSIALGGAQAANYALVSTTGTATGTITQRPIGVTGIVPQNRVYDGTTTVAINVANASVDTSSVIAGDVVGVTLPPDGISTGTVATRDVGAAKPVQVTGLGLTGSSAANYTVVGATGLAVTITPKPLTAVYAAAGKVYDGTALAAVSGSSSDILAIDAGAVGISAGGLFGDKNAGGSKTVTVSGGFLTGGARNNYSLVNASGSALATITPKLLTATYVGGSKVYDGTALALVTAQTSGIVSGDDLGFTQSASFTGAGAKNVGSGKAIAVTGIALAGADAGNYALNATNASTTGSVTPKPITVSGLSGVTAADRVYDGTTTVAVNVPAGVTLTPNSNDIVSGDQVSIGVPASGSTTGTMATKTVGTNKAVAVQGLTLDGADAGNYFVAGAAGITVNITPKPLAASYTGVTRVYDGSTSVAVTGTATGLIGGDSVTVSGSGVFTGTGAKNAGSDKPITVTLASLGGSDAVNYSLLNPTGTATGIVTRKGLTPSYSGGTRVYDGTLQASVSASGSGIVAGDVVSFAQSASYADKNVGSGKAISVSGISISGTDAANYTLLATTASTSGGITARPITLLGLTGVTATDRVYDGTRTVAVTVTASGPVSASPGDLVSGDDVQLSVPGAGTTTGTVADRNAGSLKPVVVAGLGLSGSDAGNYSIAATAGVTVNITPKPVTATYSGVNKVYDGSNAATVTGASSGIYSFDSVGIAGSGVFSAGKNVGSNLAIAVLNASLAGADAGNYALLNTTGSASASIAPKAVSAVFTGGSRVYDGTSTAPVSGSVLGMVAGDSLSLSDTAVFSDGKNVGNAKPVAVTGIALGGADAGNYALQSSTASTTASVTPRPLRIDGLTGVTATDRVYDGTTAVAVTVSASGPISPNASDLIVGDVVSVAQPAPGSTSGSMADKNVGSHKPVTVAGLTLTGADAGNYSVAAANGVTVNITPKAVTATYSGLDKVYDATATANVQAGSSGFVSGDSVSIAASGTYTGTGARNVGSAKPVAVSGGTLGGSDAANYALLNPTGSTTAGITPRPVTAAFTGDTRVYDGSSAATVQLSGLGVLGGDVVGTTQTAVFGDGRNVGSTKPILVSGIALTGADAANYALTATSASTTGGITPRPLTITGLAGLSAVDRAYDGTLVVGIVTSGGGGTATLANVVSGDNVSLLQGSAPTSGTLLDKNAGSNKPVVLAGLALTGADKDNYQLAGTAGLTVNITPRGLTATYTGIDRVYDATVAASVSATSADILAFDSLSISGTGVFIGSGAKNVGSGKAISVTGATLSGADAANYALLNLSGSATASITPRPLSASYSGGSRVYDGTLAAPVTALATGILGQDSVSFTQSAAFTDSRNVGSAKPVQISGIAIGGADAGNYALTTTTASTTASVTPRPLNVTGLTGISAVDRVYDGTRSVSLVASGAGGTAAVDDKLPGDDVRVQLPGAGITTGLMADKNAGANKPVALAGLTLTGTDAGNYAITGTAGVSVTIAPRPVVLLGLAAIDRVYDGTTAVAIASSGGSFSGAIAGDDLSLPSSGLVGAIADRHAGSARPVSLSGLGLAGADAANYTLTSAAPLTVNITPRPLQASATGIDKLYDGSTTASVSLADNRIAGDTLTLSASAAFADKNAGSAKAVTVGGITLAGADAGDYVLAGGALSATASILPRPLLVTAAPQTKLYGDAFAFSGTEFTTQGLVTGETIGQVSLASTASLAGAGVTGSPYAITAGSARGGSFDAANYVLSYAGGTFTVQPRPLTLATNTVVRYSDEANPTRFDFSASGLVNGDGIASVVQPVPAGSANAPGGSVFALVPSGAVFAAGTSAANYDLRYAAGLLVVLPKPARLTDTDVGTGNDNSGNKQLVVAVDPAELALAQAELNRAGTQLLQPQTAAPGRPMPSRVTQATADEIAIALAADSSRITLPALQRLPLVTMDPRLKRVIQGTAPERTTAAP